MTSNSPEPAPTLRRSKRASKVSEKELSEPILKKTKTTAKPAAQIAKKTSPATRKDEITSKNNNDDDNNDEEEGGAILTEGDVLPKIILQNEEGEKVDVSTLTAEKGVVLFLYPKADTPGCTKQACGFRDMYDEIAAFGYDVYGLSKDKPTAQDKWKTKQKLSYHFLSDPQSKLIKRLGAFVPPNSTKRSHFIFEKITGRLIDIDIGVKPVDDPRNVLNFLTGKYQ